MKQQKDRIDVLFANAGIGEFGSLGSISEEHFDKTFDINVKGLLFTVQKALPLFQDVGSIILNAAAAAYKGVEGYSVYLATKAAIRSLARTWTVELKQRRIRVNAVSPGPIDTQIFSSGAQNKQQSEQIKKYLTNMVPMANRKI